MKYKHINIYIYASGITLKADGYSYLESLKLDFSNSKNTVISVSLQYSEWPHWEL